MYINSMSIKALSNDERNLFNLVEQATVVNHFDPQRLKIDRKIGGVSENLSSKETFPAVIKSITNAISVLEKENRAKITDYDGEDRRIVTYTFLFELFHAYMERFDQHILDQIAHGNEPLEINFYDDAIKKFFLRGFTKSEANEYFALFFQLRRAYFFISEQLIGCSPCMQEFRSNLWNNVFTVDQLFYKRHLLNRMEDFSTLILGETGTGKGTAAASIGRSGFIPFNTKTKKFEESFTKAFVSLNLSQYPEGLIESELFGHRKGAFTGAMEEHKGIFSRCSIHGSIFLDEIGDVSIPVQIKLLQVLQERHFSPVGSHTKHRFSGRVIAATNKDINKLREDNLFRDDFYYRLCSDIFTIPSLYQRIQEDERELRFLTEHVVKNIVGTDSVELAERCLDIIDRDLGKNYRWPGNVRELEQCIRRIILKKEYHGDRNRGSSDITETLVSGIRNEELDSQSLLSQYCKLLHSRHGTFEAVSKITGLDRRTVKKYVEVG